MTIVRIGRASLRMYGVVSCVVLACVDVARADLGGDRTGDISAHQTTRNNNSDVARGGPLHLLGWQSRDDDARRTEKPSEKSRSLNHVPTRGDR